MGTITEPWNVKGKEFPVEENRSVRLEFLVRYAVLAPSTHNTQPWLFRVRSDALELFADRSRALPVCDPHQRELTISCGAALQFARTAARAFGREGRVELLPEPANPDLLARLRLGAVSSPTATEERRFRAISDRHTNRTPYEMDPVPQLDVPTLARLAKAYGIFFGCWADEAKRDRIASLVQEADLRQMSNRAHREELAKWVKSRSSGSQDGMSIGSFGLRDRMSGAASALLRTFDLGSGTAVTHGRLASNAPWLGLLSSLEDEPSDWLRTGMALADILLELTANGLACSFLNQPLELPDMRFRIPDALQTRGYPQMLMRIGRGAEVPAAARRPAHKVIGT